MNKYLLLSIVILFCLAYLSRPALVKANNPQSAHYIMQDFSLDSGGTASSSSTNYSIFANLGEIPNSSPSSQNFRLGSGLIYTMIASVPAAPTFTNPNTNYNKLLLKINPIVNPSDYTYLVAISTDGFSTDTKYIATDNTIRSSYSILDFRSFSSWGGTSGVFITGLNPGVTYTVKVKARQGFYTESGFGPTAQATTSNPTISFSISPNAVDLGNMNPGSVATSPTITTNVTTNGTAGTVVYIYDANAGLKSSGTNYTISAVSSDLSSTAEGYGAQSSSVSQTSGGPMEALSPYNGSGNTVGILNSTKQTIFDSTNQPITAGVGQFVLQAKPGLTAAAATDYTDILTVIASAQF